MRGVAKCDDWGRAPQVVKFTCNVCGASCAPERFATEPPSCECGSNVRIRGLIHLLSLELFGRGIALIDFPPCTSMKHAGSSQDAALRTRNTNAITERASKP